MLVGSQRKMQILAKTIRYPLQTVFFFQKAYSSARSVRAALVSEKTLIIVKVVSIFRPFYVHTADLPCPWDRLDPCHRRIIFAAFYTQLNTNIVRTQLRVERERFALVFFVLQNQYRTLARK